MAAFFVSFSNFSGVQIRYRIQFFLENMSRIDTALCDLEAFVGDMEKFLAEKSEETAKVESLVEQASLRLDRGKLKLLT